MHDPQRFRVTLLGTNDYAEGYGATAEEADEKAKTFYNRYHSDDEQKPERILECVTPDGSRYVEVGV